MDILDALTALGFEPPDGWGVMTLGQVCVAAGGDIQTGPFGSQLHANDYVDDGVPVVMPVNIGDNNRINTSGIARISEADAIRLKRHRLQAGDIVFGRRGDLTRRALVRDSESGWLCGTGCLRIRPGVGGAIPNFLALYLGHPGAQAWIERHAVGATMQNLNTSILGSLPVVVPPVREQRRIARMLGVLDDKIKHNSQLGGHLVQASEFAFASLIANSRGWSSKPIGEVVTIVGGSTPSTSVDRFWGGEIRFATPRDLAQLEFPVLVDTERRITEEGLKQISSGLLPRGTVLLSSRAPIGYLAIADEPIAVNQGFIAMVCDMRLPTHYVFWWARRNIDTIISRANGTTFLEISKRAFRPIEIPIPTSNELAIFQQVVVPLHGRLTAAIRETRTLTAIRNALLPKLVSGAVRVPDSYDPDEALGTVADAAGAALP